MIEKYPKSKNIAQVKTCYCRNLW